MGALQRPHVERDRGAHLDVRDGLPLGLQVAPQRARGGGQERVVDLGAQRRPDPLDPLDAVRPGPGGALVLGRLALEDRRGVGPHRQQVVERLEPRARGADALAEVRRARNEVLGLGGGALQRRSDAGRQRPPRAARWRLGHVELVGGVEEHVHQRHPIADDVVEADDERAAPRAVVEGDVRHVVDRPRRVRERHRRAHELAHERLQAGLAGRRELGRDHDVVDGRARIRRPARAAAVHALDAHAEAVVDHHALPQPALDVVDAELAVEADHARDGHRVVRALHAQPGGVGGVDGEGAGRRHRRAAFEDREGTTRPGIGSEPDGPLSGSPGEVRGRNGPSAHAHRCPSPATWRATRPRTASTSGTRASSWTASPSSCGARAPRRSWTRGAARGSSPTTSRRRCRTSASPGSTPAPAPSSTPGSTSRTPRATTWARSTACPSTTTPSTSSCAARSWSTSTAPTTPSTSSRGWRGGTWP